MKTHQILATLILVLVMVLVSIAPAMVSADSGNPAIPTRTVKPVEPANLQQKLQEAQTKGGGGGYIGKLDYINVQANPGSVRVYEPLTVTVSVDTETDFTLWPMTVEVITDEYWQSTTMYTSSVSIPIIWFEDGIKIVNVIVTANGGSKATNSVTVNVKPAPLSFGFVNYWTICIEGWSCQLNIMANRAPNPEDMRNGPVYLVIALWWPGETATYDLIQVNEELTTYTFTYQDKTQASRGFWVDLYGHQGYQGSSYIFMLDPAAPWINTTGK